MCGICGIFNTKNAEKAVPLDILIQMRDALIHRGPDDSGEFIDNNVGLAMRRLNIIDLDTGHQPIHNEDKSIWIVFNGEIYNYPELRKELIERGHKFYSKSDTEVIVHLYEEMNSSCIDKLNGMFAFCIWDSRKNSLFLARDRMGQKPLYYKFSNGEFIFSSEIKSLLKHPSVSRELDFEALNEYLTYEYVPSPRSIFKEIKKLPAGHRMVVNKDGVFLERYWHPENRSPLGADRREVEERLFGLLQDSVKRHMISDVPLGVFLSGGIDSSAIAALASRCSKKIKTFSVSFDDKSFDESRYSRVVADFIGSDHHEMKFSEKDCLDIIPRMYDFIDEPFADASVFPTYLLAKFTRSYVTVALGGDGSDELFAGYPTHLAHIFADNFYLRLPSLLRKQILERVGNNLPVSFNNFSLDFKVKKFISGIDYVPEIRHQLWMGSFSPAQKAGLLTDSVKSELIEDGLTGPINRNKLSAVDLKPGRENILFLDMMLYLQDDILTKLDRCSMASSLEARSPFLDNDLLDFANSIDFKLKLKLFKSKFILKKVLVKNKVLPVEVISRSKKGFGIPVAKWISRELKPLIMDTLSEESINKAGIFNYQFVKQILKEHFDMKKDNRKLIWTLFMFELWKNKYLN